MEKKIVVHIYKKKRNTRVKNTLLSLLVIILILQAVKINIENDLSIKDYEYAYLLLQIKRQIQENTILYEEILHNEAFITISGETKDMGFEDAIYMYMVGK